MPTQEARTNIMGLMPHELVPLLPSGHERPYRATQILEWIYRRGQVDFDAMTNLPLDLRARASERYAIGALTEERATTSASGDATKYLWRLADGKHMESVRLVMAEGTRDTLCISSQVGCAYGCTFCATATMGFIRHLDPQEIFEQVFHMRRVLQSERPGAPSYNIVFMGMGEPLANYANVIEAIRRLTSPDGLGIAERRITISTCGLAERIRRLAGEDLDVGLAISLNATTDADRLRTMPVTKKHAIEELLDAASEWARATGRRVTFEYVLLRDENDREEDIDRLRAISQQVPCKINVIPLNPFPGVGHARPDTRWIETFLAKLMRPPSPAVTRRMTRGLDIAAACGQLAVSAS